MNYRMLDILKNESKKQNKVTPADAVQKPEVTKKGKNNKVMDSSNVSAIEENANKQEQQPVVEIGSKPSLQTAIQNSQTDLVDQVDIQKQKTEKLYNKIKGIASR